MDIKAHPLYALYLFDVKCKASYHLVSIYEVGVVSQAATDVDLKIYLCIKTRSLEHMSHVQNNELHNMHDCIRMNKSNDI